MKEQIDEASSLTPINQISEIIDVGNKEDQGRMPDARIELSCDHSVGSTSFICSLITQRLAYTKFKLFFIYTC